MTTSPKVASTTAAPTLPTTVAAPAVEKSPVAKPAATKTVAVKTSSAAKAPAPKAKAVKTKTVKSPVAAAAAKPKAVAASKPTKVKKPKLVRDSFTIPKAEYVVLDELKQRTIKLAQPAKKSELLRAGIKALAAMSDSALRTALQAVPAIKTGRPAAASADVPAAAKKTLKKVAKKA